MNGLPRLLLLGLDWFLPSQLDLFCADCSPRSQADSVTYARLFVDDRHREHTADEGSERQRDLLPFPSPPWKLEDMSLNGHVKPEDWTLLRSRLVVIVISLNWESGYRSPRYARLCWKQASNAQAVAMCGLADRVMQAVADE